MQQAWNAAVVAFKEFIDALENGELIASGVNPTTGVRCEIDPAEWTRTGLILDVRNGDLIEGTTADRLDKRTVRWSAITLRAAKATRHREAWHGYDWEERGRTRSLARDSGMSTSRTRSNLREVRRR